MYHKYYWKWTGNSICITRGSKNKQTENVEQIANSIISLDSQIYRVWIYLGTQAAWSAFNQFDSVLLWLVSYNIVYTKTF